MTEKEYMENIEQLRSGLTRENAQEISAKLDELFAIKPVRLPWFIAKAETLMKLKKKPGEIFALLNGKARYIYNYRGIGALAESYAKIHSACGNYVDAKRNKLLPCFSIKDFSQAQGKDVEQSLCSLEQRKEVFLDHTTSDDALLQLQETYYITSKYVSYSLVSYLLEKRKIAFKKRDFIEKQLNFGYLKERFFSDNPEMFLIIAEPENITDCEIAATICSLFGRKVYLFTPPILCPVQSDINIKETVSVSLDHIQQNDGVTVITPVELVLEDKSVGTNIGELIHYLINESSENKLATVLCSGHLMDELCKFPLLQKQMERLSCFIAEGMENDLSFGWAGSYLTYISNIYGFNAETAINKTVEERQGIQYSIVIPTRNSAASLRHTLKTCLEIDYPKDSYEIVISDNSTNNNAEVYNLCQELNDDRIKYYRTPRDLHLPKSFEYAYLKARGEFILSIGSDDAILPWALKVLDDIQKKYPQEEIIQWERGFYAWPGFNGGQQHQFVIPSAYKNRVYNERYVRGADYLKGVLNNSEIMYALPMLYINSGFKRSYMNTLIEKTGRLWDGICQDIYMGVINVIINNAILTLRYPLTIAGMTNGSVGATCMKANISDTQLSIFNDDVRQTGNVGGFSMSMTERLMPDLRSDVSSLYNSLLRAVARGVLSEQYMWTTFAWAKMFAECIQLLDIRDIEYDKLIHYTRYTASLHGERFCNWFDEQIYRKVMEPRVIDEQAVSAQGKKKTYKEGKNTSGGRTVDASRYGVTNSYEAMKLFVKLSGLA